MRRQPAPEAQVGDQAYAHTGYATIMVDEEEALESLRLLRELAGAYPQEDLFYSTG